MSDTSETSNTSDTSNVFKELEVAVKGLLWPSDSDKAIKAVSFAADDTQVPIKLVATEKAKTVSVDDLFAPVVAQQDWFSEEEKATAVRFQSLKDMLTKRLRNVTSFRMEDAHEDRSRVDVYVLGVAPDGSVNGIITQLIET